MRNVLAIVGTRSQLIRLSALCSYIKQNSVAIDLQWVYIGTDDDVRKLAAELGIEKPVKAAFIDQTQPDNAFPQTMRACEKILMEQKPSAVLIIGDSITSCAASFAATIGSTPTIKLSGGARYQRGSVREDAYAVFTDHLANIVCADDEESFQNLHTEGKENCVVTGSLMIDAAIQHEKQAQLVGIHKTMKLIPFEYGMLAVHRSENILRRETSMELFGAACEIQNMLPLISPMHPHTKKTARAFGMQWNTRFAPQATRRISYKEHAHLLQKARVVITDSTGIQEEATAFGVPCITVMPTTTKGYTIEDGTNVCVGTQREDIVSHAKRAMSGRWKRRSITLPLHDGESAQRTCDGIATFLKSI